MWCRNRELVQSEEMWILPNRKAPNKYLLEEERVARRQGAAVGEDQQLLMLLMCLMIMARLKQLEKDMAMIIMMYFKSFLILDFA